MHPRGAKNLTAIPATRRRPAPARVGPPNADRHPPCCRTRAAKAAAPKGGGASPADRPPREREALPDEACADQQVRLRKDGARGSLQLLSFCTKARSRAGGPISPPGDAADPTILLRRDLSQHPSVPSHPRLHIFWSGTATSEEEENFPSTQIFLKPVKRERERERI